VKAHQHLGRQLLRWRYPVLAAWTLGWLAIVRVAQPKLFGGDWPWFEAGARTLIHLNSHYSTGALSLYVHFPEIQVGPPPLMIVAALQWLPPAVVRLGMAVVVALAGVWCLRCVELIVGRAVAPERAVRLQTLVFRAGLLALPIWGWESGRWEHLDDVMAIAAAMTAMAIIASGRRWWLAAFLVGIAIASKPWALVVAPCLLGLPREQRARASLVTILTAAACWGPFVLGDSQTVSALGSFQFPVDHTSTMHLLGVPLGNAPKWVRPAQFVGGFLIALAAVRQRRWLAVPLIAFAFRVVVDPQTWIYYGIGPLIGAVLWDAAVDRKWPAWTIATAVAEFGVPTIAPSWAGPVRLVWFLLIAVAVLRPNHDPAPDLEAAHPAREPLLVAGYR
jgi:hypothetical protein